MSATTAPTPSTQTTPRPTRRGVVCVLVAAGSGTRLAAGRPKAFVPVAGEALVVHAARSLGAAGVLDRLVVVVPSGLEAETHGLLSGLAPPGLRVVPGGAHRQDSVAAGLAAVPEDAGVVLVHDAARALVPAPLVARVVTAVAEHGHAAVVPGVPVHDTLRTLAGGVVDREHLRAVQTPQGFTREVLARAHAAERLRAEGASDDAGLVEALGVPVHLVVGEPEAFKITRPLDLLLAEAVLARRAATAGGAGR